MPGYLIYILVSVGTLFVHLLAWIVCSIFKGQTGQAVMEKELEKVKEDIRSIKEDPYPHSYTKPADAPGTDPRAEQGVPSIYPRLNSPSEVSVYSGALPRILPTRTYSPFRDGPSEPTPQDKPASPQT